MLIIIPILGWLERKLVAEEGAGIGVSFKSRTLHECQSLCDEDNDCNSIAYSLRYQICYLKDKCVTAEEPTNSKVRWYKSYYRPCPMPGINISIHVRRNDTSLFKENLFR